MKTAIRNIVLMLASMALLSGIVAAQDVELTFRCYQDGSECDIYRSLLDEFESANEGITINIDVVPYSAIDEQLPIQVQAGEAPDFARITNFGGFAGFYLDMRPYLSDEAVANFDDNFPNPVMAAMRNDRTSDAIGGYPDLFSVTAPYINRTLFEQADVAIPSDENPEASWADWTVAAAEVSEALSDSDITTYGIAIDRTGHRFAGPAMSMGATLIDEDGMFTVDTEGYRMMAELLKEWHDTGITPAEVWLGGGGSYAAAADFFINGQLAVYMSGSWQIGRFAADVGDTFDWEVVPNPTGDGGSTGVAGGSGIAAFEQTEHPEEVALVMAYLSSPEVYAEYAAQTLSIPANSAVAEMGVEYDSEDEAVLAALSVFSAEVPKLQDQAVAMNVNPFAFAYYRNSANRLEQYLVGELTLDEALSGLQQDIDDAVDAASEETSS